MRILACSLIVLSALCGDNYTYCRDQNKQKVKITSNQEVVAKIEQALNEISTLKSDAVQVDKFRVASSFRIFLDRKAQKMKIVSDKYTVIIKDGKITSYDKELKEKTVVSVFSNPLAFLLDRKIKLDRNARIVYVKEDDKYWFVKCCGKKDNESSKNDADLQKAILLIFSKETSKLQGWIIFDNESDETPEKSIRVSLYNEDYSAKIGSNEFERFN